MQLKSLDFLLTFKCPSKCKHCSYRAGPDRTGFIDLEQAEKWLTELIEIQPLQSITVHGGEPFLYFKVLKGIFKKAKEFGIQERWVITNAYWAETEEVAEKKLSELKEAGLKCITFSVDAFHQEYIPIETVKTGIKVATKIGFEKVAVDSYILGMEDLNNEYNIMTRYATSHLKDFTNVRFAKFPVDLEGRASDYLVDFVEPSSKIPDGKCQFPFWLGGDLKNPEGIEIDFQGNVTLCPGICIGNAKSQSLIDILENYSYDEHPIIQIIAEDGPIGLLRLAKEKGYREDKKFINECHLCYEMRRFLQPYYPEFLAPSSCY
ncbi:MAG: radical SAM protein [Candidatus Bathyarchaeota archaeon]|nr:radical SAM protein [Candidatus Bathyarchaeota archaeon]